MKSKDIFSENSRFPQRNIIGFSDSTTQQTQPQRGKFINEAIRDIVILSESDFIVCTMSSNVSASISIHEL
jgi:hypothetical protein